MSGASQKICPRKFSEKIALLNKKEAEGNAKFEEIIKEVQATRSGGVIIKQPYQRGFESNVKDDCSRDELEEVFESLIKCVGQYEEELQEDTQAQKSFGSAQAMCHNDQIVNQNCARSASAEIFPNPNGARPNSSNLPYQQQLANQNRSNQSIRVIAQPLIENNDLAYRIPCSDQPQQMEERQQHASRINSDEVKSAFNDMTEMRTRVTSIGSASYNKYVCSNGQYQLRNDRASSQNARSIWPENTGIYLSEPSQDKSWQKSSSVPALHVSHVPLDYNAAPDSNIPMAGSPMQQQSGCVQANINQQQAPSANNAMINGYEQQSNSSTAYVADQMNSNLMLTDRVQPMQPRMFNQITKSIPQNQVVPQSYSYQQEQQVSSPMEVGDSDVSGRELAGALPGIKICAFDETPCGRRLIPTRVGSKDSSLPDIATLQFTAQPTAVGRAEQLKPTQSVVCKDQLQSTNIVHQQAQRKDQKQLIMYNQEPCQYDQQVHRYQTQDSMDANLNLINYMPADVATTSETANDTNYNPSNRIGILVNASQDNLGASNDLNNNIIRSHSHNSIDNLAKHKLSSNNPGGRSSPYPNVHQLSQSQKLYSHHQDHRSNLQLRRQQNQHKLRHFDMSMNPASYMCCGSNDSMRPQYGSTSPINSSSNLASPQSDQNSPGSCEIEQVDLNNNVIKVLYEPVHADENVASSNDVWQYSGQQADYDSIATYQCEPPEYTGQFGGDQSVSVQNQQTALMEDGYGQKTAAPLSQSGRISREPIGYSVIRAPLNCQPSNIGDVANAGTHQVSGKVIGPASGDGSLQESSQFYTGGSVRDNLVGGAPRGMRR